MNNFKIPLSILLAVVGALIGLVAIFPELLIVLVLVVVGFVAGRVLESPELRQKFKEFFSLE